MNVWRLMAHHDEPARVAEWSRRSQLIAIGWGGTGDLRQQNVHNESGMKYLVADKHPGFSTSSCVNGGCSLWRFYGEMQIGDLVIVSASGWRALTMRLTGDYFYTPNDPTHSYEHRRKADAVPIDPNYLWQVASGMMPGENIRRALVRCARPMTDAELERLAG